MKETPSTLMSPRNVAVQSALNSAHVPVAGL